MSDTLGIYQLGLHSGQTWPDAISIQAPNRAHDIQLDILSGGTAPFNAFGYPDILLGSADATLMLVLIQDRNLYDASAHVIPTDNQIHGHRLDMFDTDHQ